MQHFDYALRPANFATNATTSPLLRRPGRIVRRAKTGPASRREPAASALQAYPHFFLVRNIPGFEAAPQESILALIYTTSEPARPCPNPAREILSFTRPRTKLVNGDEQKNRYPFRWP